MGMHFMKGAGREGKSPPFSSLLPFLSLDCSLLVTMGESARFYFLCFHNHRPSACCLKGLRNMVTCRLRNECTSSLFSLR
ncbi:hypothetical protein PMAYCL1PPCAC_28977 [Pristionchus mayeri]|uniref:Uncharacterized protein n=1 Tax=Pristionchus mayeri TaxID=1317129 RepID=A0AAN5IAG7_9BILA|nr:hypothetical protein PMAYCL1PPCAC_28977 [Pristionchus mayeri]